MFFFAQHATSEDTLHWTGKDMKNILNNANF